MPARKNRRTTRENPPRDSKPDAPAVQKDGEPDAPAVQEEVSATTVVTRDVRTDGFRQR